MPFRDETRMSLTAASSVGSVAIRRGGDDRLMRRRRGVRNEPSTVVKVKVARQSKNEEYVQDCVVRPKFDRLYVRRSVASRAKYQNVELGNGALPLCRVRCLK
jgi:hypothetical protein